MDKNLKYNHLPGLTAPFEPQVYECPYHDHIQLPLIDWVEEKASLMIGDDTKCFRTPPQSGDKRDITEHNVLFGWIESLIAESVYEFCKWTNSAYNVSPESCKKFKIADYWGMLYGDGYGTVPHNHFPFALSFGYYLRTPNGCAPLIIDEQSIQVTEGRLIVFGGHQTHYVPDSDISGRCMIAGDISYGEVINW